MKAQNIKISLTKLIESFLTHPRPADKTKVDFLSYCYKTLRNSARLWIPGLILFAAAVSYFYPIQSNTKLLIYITTLVTAVQAVFIGAIVVKNAFFEINNNDNIDISRILSWITLFGQRTATGREKNKIKELARLNLLFFRKYWKRFWMSSFLLYAVLLFSSLKFNLLNISPFADYPFDDKYRLLYHIVINLFILFFNSLGAVWLFMCFVVMQSPFDLETQVSGQIESIKNLSSSLYVGLVLMLLFTTAYYMKTYATEFSELSTKEFLSIRKESPAKFDAVFIKNHQLIDSLLNMKKEARLDTFLISNKMEGIDFDKNLLYVYQLHVIKEINKDSQILSGMFFCIALALLIARLDSRVVHISYKVIALLFSYTSIQPLLNFVQSGPEALTILILLLAFLLKVVFFLAIDYAINTKRIIDLMVVFPIYQQMIETEGWPEQNG